MRIIQPIDITPSMAVFERFTVEPGWETLDVQATQFSPGGEFRTAALVTNVRENLWQAWAPNTAYAIGYRVTHNHRDYEALIANTDVDPSVPTDPKTWLDLGASNPWRMFDDKVGTKTVNQGRIEVAIAPSTPVDALAFFGVVAESVRVRAIDPFLGITYESELFPISTDGIDNWYDYLFAPIQMVEDFVVTDIPVSGAGTVEVLIANPSGSAEIGALVVGRIAELGVALYGTSVGITDYSRKDRDEFGNFTVVERGFSKRIEYDVAIETASVGRVQRVLAKYRARPLVWIGEESYEATIVYGYYRDFDISISGPTVSDATISVEGLN